MKYYDDQTFMRRCVKMNRFVLEMGWRDLQLIYFLDTEMPSHFFQKDWYWEVHDGTSL